MGEEYTLLVAHLALDGWEWLPCTVEKSDSTILLQFETESFSPFAILAVEERTAFEGFLEEIHALTRPAGDADEAAVAAYEAAVAELRAQLAAARESGVLTDEECAALLALLPAEETAYEALLAKVQTLESRGGLDDAMLADG